MRWRIGGALGESAALLAQDVQRLVDGRIADFSADLFDFGVGQISNLDFRIHLENRIKSQLAFRRVFFFADAGLAGNAELGFIGRNGKRLTDLVIHDFVMH